MTLEDVLGSVESEDVKEAIIGLINTEKDLGIQKYSKKDKEVLKYKNALTQMGYDKEKYEDIDSFIVDQKDTKSKVKDANLTVATLNDKLNDVMSQLDEERTRASQKTQEAKENKMASILQSKIGQEFYGSEYLIKDLIREGRVDLKDDNVVFKQGDDYIGFDDGYKSLKDTNKNMLRVNQKGGTGDVGGETIDPKEKGFADLLADRLK